MPIFLEPDQKFPVVLDVDANKPKGTQPTFWAKSQSMRGQLKIAEVLDAIPDAKSAESMFEGIVDCLAEVFVDWSNMGEHPFSRDSLYELLAFSEACELLRKVMHNQHVTVEEKKSSE